MPAFFRTRIWGICCRPAAGAGIRDCLHSGKVLLYYGHKAGSPSLRPSGQGAWHRTVIQEKAGMEGRGEKGKKADKNYDVVVVGSGSGMAIVENAINKGLRVALVDRGPAGGTCLNVGCIPSKMLVAAADRVMEIREADRFGIRAAVESIDFARIMREMRDAVAPEHKQIREALAAEKRLDYYEDTARFIGARQLAAGDYRLRGEKIFIASGSRPVIPDIDGLDRLPYLTSESLLELTELPRSLVIVGGGYIAAEYGHFFSAMGTDVTIVHDRERLVPTEEPEISQILEFELSRRMKVLTGASAVSAHPAEGGCSLKVSQEPDGEIFEVSAERLLVAAGRKSNADLLDVEKAGIETDTAGFIRTDPYLQTSSKGVWAVGDINGRQMFTHTANAEADAAWENAVNGASEAIHYEAVPRAIFTYPPVAAVGMTAQEAAKTREVLVGSARYSDVAKGMALREDRGMAKVVLEQESLNLLGFHIIGPQAPILIQEVVNAMAIGGRPGALFSGQHIHPSLSEIIPKAFSNLSKPE